MNKSIHSALRIALLAFWLSLLSACGGGGDGGSQESTAPPPSQESTAPPPIDPTESGNFPNGVAAGDVDQTSVVLWARSGSTGRLTFEYGQDSSFPRNTVRVGTRFVEDSKIPVKLRISGLLAGTQYHYRVCKGDSCPPNSQSPGPQEERGKFRTPFADGRNGLRFGVSSCWRKKERPFWAIKNIPDRNLDFFIALGDTVYADDFGASASTYDEFLREHDLGYSKIEGRNFFAKARASTASFVDIDDHEIVNNFQGGASPKSQRLAVECLVAGSCFCTDVGPILQPNIPNCERDFINETDLFRAGLQAWKDFNPVDDIRYGNTGDPRTANKDKLYRYRAFGKDAAIFMLDTRSFRDAPVAIVSDVIPVFAYAQGRTMLGAAQLSDLMNDLDDAQTKGIQWKFVLVPEPIQNIGKFGASDRFEGYAYERFLILDHIRKSCITNVVFISGDIHGTLVNNLVYKKDFVDSYIYSSTWDISTGPAGHKAPMALATLDKALAEPITGCSWEHYWGNLSTRDERNLYFQTCVVDDTLDKRGFPLVGLNIESPIRRYRDWENAITPANLIDVNPDDVFDNGLYSSTNTNGWTEFEINAVTHNLLVTTWGIERNEKADEVNPEIGPVKVSQFEVAPRGRNDISCGDGLPDGSFCARDSVCASGRCSRLECLPKVTVGSSCRRDSDCRSGNCSNELLPRNRTCG